MKHSSVPRIVVVTRPSQYQTLLERHGTRNQAKFFVESRGQDLDEVQGWHDRFTSALGEVSRVIPKSWRRVTVDRGSLDRFLFEPGDVVVAVGQDGLVPNVAKYLTGQLVIGINPEPDRQPGILVLHTSEAAGDLIWAAGQRNPQAVQERTMVEARFDDGQRLIALNEVFIGQRTHQSALYRIRVDSDEERHSSSGIIVSTGTGATGWASSVNREREQKMHMPAPSDPALAWFVREAWNSPWTGVSLSGGRLAADQNLEVISEMSETGVVFGDGIEDDCVHFGWGQKLTVGTAKHRLQLMAA